MKDTIFSIVFLLCSTCFPGSHIQETIMQMPPCLPNASNAVTVASAAVAENQPPESSFSKGHRKFLSHPDFDIPDVCYFIGGPVFLLIFFRVLAIFLHWFEELKKEENQPKTED